MFLIECSIRVTSEVNSLGGALHKSCSYKWKTVAMFRPFGIQDDNVKCPNYVPRGRYRPSYFFLPFSRLPAQRRGLVRSARRGFFRNCNYGRSWRRSSVSRCLIRILLTRREAGVYVFISHESFRIALALGVTRDSGDYAEKKCIPCNLQRTEFKRAMPVIFYAARNFELNIEF